MAKKRTTIPGYGKINQRLEAAATAALKGGNREEAARLYAKSGEVLKARRAELGK